MNHYYKHKIENLINIKSIVTIEYLDLYKGYHYPTETHDFWELIYIDKGTINYYIDNKLVVLNQGEMLFLKPSQTHSIEVNEKAPSIFVLCFECQSSPMSFFSNYISKINCKTKEIIEAIIKETKCTFVMPFNKQLETLNNPNLGGQQVIRINLELLLIHLLREEQNSNATHTQFIKNTNFSNKICDDICSYLVSKIYNTISIKDICKRTNYSKTYVCQLFKQIMGTSIVTYYNIIKIEEAKKLIRENTYTITQISNILHFTDPRYFSVLFKKLTGKSPAQYKNSVNKS